MCRVALVSGGIGGLGTRICIQLAESGHTVVALDLAASETRLAEFGKQIGSHDIHFEAGDVTDFATCTALVQRLEQRSEERRVGKACVIRVDLGGRRIIKKNIE